jgi:GDP-D-mannose dehydratase
MNKRALITGMVGSHLADFLLANTDWDIFGMCRWRSPLDNMAHLLDRANKKDIHTHPLTRKISPPILPRVWGRTCSVR